MARSTRSRRVTAGALTAALLAATAGSATVAAPVVLGGGWQVGGWQAAVSGVASTTMADVAKAVGASATGLDGTGVGVALIDTGVAPVPGLPAARVVNGPDLSVESQAATLRYLDSFGHGTHMAGIIAGSDTSAGFQGLAPGVKLTSVKVGTANGAVDVTQVIAAIDWVVDHRNDDRNNPIRVLNLSYGTPGNAPSYLDPLTFAVENAWNHGIVVVVAGGNGGRTTGLTNPGYDPFVLSVGSSTPDGTALSAFTNTSNTRTVDWSVRSIDVAAPGEGIVSLRDPGSNVDTLFPIARVGDSLFRGSGTSQATAVVSGAVALLLQKRPWLDPDQVKALLKASATRLTSGVGATQGIGVVNVANALRKSAPDGYQYWTEGSGAGSLDSARGGVTVVKDTHPLKGENSLFGGFIPAVWAEEAADETSWQGGTWMGWRIAGDGWTGTSWASKTWGSATWAGGAWDGSGTWTDDSWSGHYWSNGEWSGHYWSGHYWSSDGWATANWG
jgi:serine protease AprX